MEVAIRGTTVTVIGNNVIGFEQNNLVNNIVGTVDTEAGWEFSLKVYMTKTMQYNQIPLTRDNNIIFTKLTADMIPVGGKYVGQFEMTKGQQLAQTEKFEFWVENSINLNEVWTPIPTTFTELATNTRILQQHPPIPGDKGYWMLWDLETSEYKTSVYPLPSNTDSGLVTSFNGRTGAVTSQAGDYTPEMVGSISSNGGTVNGNLVFEGENKITIAIEPQEDNDVVNKQYVDSNIEKIDKTNIIESLPEQIMVQLVNVNRTETTNTAEIQIATKQEDGTYSTSVQHGVLTLIGAGQGIDGKQGAGLMILADKNKLDGIPAPTIEDNGKILVVENGRYSLKNLNEIQG